MDLVVLLRSQHEMITGMLDMLASGPSRGSVRKRILLGRLAEVIELNGGIEQRILSIAIRRSDESELLHVPLFARLERHRAISSVLLPDLLDADSESRLFEGRLFVLRETAQTLFNDEAGRLFARIAKLFSAEELAAFVDQIDLAALTHFKQL